MTDQQRARLEEIRSLLEVRMRDRERRYIHSLGVAQTAVNLAREYGVDEYDAAYAGLLHDLRASPYFRRCLACGMPSRGASHDRSG